MSTITIEVYESAAWVDHTTDCVECSISDSLVERNTAAIAFASNTWAPLQGERIRVNHSDEGYLFNGTILSISRSQVQVAAAPIRSECTCVSREAVLSQRTTGSRGYTNEHLGDIISDLITNCAGGEGFTLTGVQEGPSIAEINFDFQPLRDAFDQLCSMASDTTDTWHWAIGTDDDVMVFPQDSYAAPLDLTSAICQSVTVSETGEKLANRVAVRLGKLIRAAGPETIDGYGSPKQQTFYTTLPIAAEPTVYHGSPAEYYTVGIEGVDTGKDVYWSLNSTTLTFSAGLGVGETAYVEYSAYETAVVDWVYDGGAIVARAALEGGTGYHEVVLEQSTPTTSAQAAELAQSYLDVFKNVPIAVEATTRTAGFHAGQLVNVDIAELGIDRTMLIESVGFQVTHPGVEPGWRVRAVDGALLGDWKTRLRDIITGGHSITAGVVTGGGDGGGTGTTTPTGYPDAPNVTSASCAAYYTVVGGILHFGFTGTITLPTGNSDYDHLKRIRVVAVGPTSDTRQLAVAVHDDVDFTGSTLGYKSQTWPVNDYTGTWDVEFRCENEDGKITASPYTAADVAVAGITVSSVVLSATGSRYSDATQLTHFTTRTTFNLSSNPGNLSCTIWLSYDNGSTWNWIGWFDRSGTSGVVIDLDALVPEATTNWKSAICPRQVGRTSTLPADAVASAAFSVTGLQLPADTAVTGLSLHTPAYDREYALGQHDWYTTLSGTCGTDPYGWDICLRFRAEDVAGNAAPSELGGDWTPWLALGIVYVPGSSWTTTIPPDGRVWGYNPIDSIYHYGRVEVSVTRRYVSGVSDRTTIEWPDNSTSGVFDFGNHPERTIPTDQFSDTGTGQGLGYDPFTGKFSVLHQNLSNLITDPSFEFSTSGVMGNNPSWTHTSAAEIKADTGKHGAKYVRLTGAAQQAAQWVQVEAGEAYYLVGWLRSSNTIDTNHKGFISLRWFNADRSTQVDAFYPNVSGYKSDWTRLLHYFQAPTGAHWLYFCAETAFLEPSDGWWDFDALWLGKFKEYSANGQTVSDFPKSYTVGGGSGYTGSYFESDTDNSAVGMTLRGFRTEASDGSFAEIYSAADYCAVYGAENGGGGADFSLSASNTAAACVVTHGTWGTASISTNATTPGLNIQKGSTYTNVFPSQVVTSVASYNNAPLILGGYYLWIDGMGRVRIKYGAPTSDTDGNVVGLQS